MQKSQHISPFILQKIKTTAWHKRAYINDLLKLRQWIIKGTEDDSCSALFVQMKLKYTQEYLSLLQEISPENYQLELAQRAQYLQEQWDQLRANKERQRKEAQQEMEEYQEWMAMGAVA